MKKVILSVALAMSAMAVQAQVVKFEWANKIGGTNNESANGIAVDSMGNVYTAGNFMGTTTFDSSGGVVISSYGANDIYITKYNAAGLFLWAKNIGGISDDLVRGIAVDNDYVYITGNFNQTCDFDPAGGSALNLTSSGIGDVFVAKYEAISGNVVWAKKMGGTAADLGFSIAVDKDGNVYTTGNYASTCDFDPGVGSTALTAVGSSDIFISKLNKDGNFEWVKSIGGTGADGGVSIAIDNAGNPIIGGSFVMTADFDPSSSSTSLTSYGSGDIFITKFSSAGLMLWAKQIGGIGAEYLEFLTSDKWGNAVFTGRYANDADFDPGASTVNLAGVGRVFVAKLNNNGNFVWAKKLGSSGVDERSKAVAVDTMGNVYTIGEHSGTNDFDPGAGTANLTSIGSTDIFVSKLDSFGNYQWVGGFGGTSSDASNAIAIGKNVSVYIAGNFYDIVDFDPSAGVYNIVSKGSNDAFVAKWNQCIFTVGITKSGNTLTADMAGVNYQWVNYPSYTPIAGATMQSFTATTSGAYTVILTNAIGCKDTLEHNTVTVTSIQEHGFGTSINLYPNPAQNFVTIDYLPIAGKVALVDLLGNVVLELPISNSKITIDTKNFAKGMYFLHISNAASESSIKKLSIN